MTPQTEMHPQRWGDPAAATSLPDTARGLIELVFGIDEQPAVDGATPPAPTVGAEALTALEAVVGPDQVLVDDAIRTLRTRGKSTPDLLKARAGDLTDAPDVVVRPAGQAEIEAVLAVAAAHRLAVVPFGGGTSVVGGVDPESGSHALVVALDLERTAALLELDETSLLATFGAGTTGPQAEELLATRGYTLGHFPQSFEYATIGGFAATRSSGQASRGYGRFDDVVHALRVATPVGELSLGRAPASAAGPDLRELFLGSEGAFGVLTEVTVRIRPVAAVTRYGAWTFPDFASGAEAVRLLTQRGIRPTVLRLSDETETRVNAVMGAHLTRLRGCLAVATFEGATPDEAGSAADATDTLFAAHGGRSRGEDPARSWERGRFAPPALRDALLDIGVLAETLETASRWADLPGLKRAVTDALTAALTAEGTKPIVLCHISHVYPAGASLYLTGVSALWDDPLAQWGRATDAASRAIGSAGGTITHHHAVGRDHSAYLEGEIGAVGVDILRAVKNALDPRGIMNPGVLVPAASPHRGASGDHSA